MEDLLKRIVAGLQQVNPRRIILFGSHAKGDFHEESDIDLVVILDTEKIPASYDQKLELKAQVRDSIYDLSREMAIDLVVYTNGEFEVLKQQGTSFYSEIMDNGKTLYEKAG